jgi:threonine aldolase
MPELIDLRSDTVTRPTPEMRRAMAEAEVGDDVFRDDPTVIALEERAAELTGKAAGLFVASGTMGNLVSHMAWVPRGGEIIADAEAHLVLDEAAGHAVITGASVRPIPAGADGTLDPAAIAEAFRDPTDAHEPLTALLAIENTHAHSMGQPISAAATAAAADIAHARGIPVHVDGARLFHAAVALRTSARELLAAVESATFCLSKGLACPVGSLVVGDADFIARARRARKMVGGGMRQVGVLAAPGLVALRDGPAGMIERLADDHLNARLLADRLAEMDGITGLDPERVRTNFVLFRLAGGGGEAALMRRAAFLDRLAAEGVLMVPYAHGQVRAVTHHGIETRHLDRVAAVVRRALDAATPTVARA